MPAIYAMFAPAEIYSLVFLAIEILAVISAIHAIWYVRTSQAAIAWVVALITFSPLALPTYWIFGRYRFRGYRESIREVGRRHKRSVSAINRELLTMRNARTTALDSPIEQIADILDTPICSGNTAQLLIDGDDFYDTFILQISKATRYVYVEFYIIRDDEIGNRVAEALMAKARQGIVVRFLYDEIGSWRVSRSYLQRLSAAGVEIRPFNTRRGLANPFQLNFRNHRKMLIVDGRVSIVGGFNLGDEYAGKLSWAKHWRDTAVLLHGPITLKIQAIFAGDYYWAARQDLREADWDNSDKDQSTGMCNASVCVTGPADLQPRATMMFASAALAARERLWISTPYLVPDETCLVTLTMACARGVDVRILAPSVPDQWAVYLAGLHYEVELQRAGIQVYRYQAGAMHQKCILVDDKLALLGSTNLDNRSLHLNFEVMVALEGREFVSQVATMLERDFAQSSLARLGDRPAHPGMSILGRIVARLFSPIL